MLLRECWRKLVVALAVLCPAVSAQQKPSISGIVHQVEGMPVSHAAVSVEGAGATVTSDSGEFALPMTSNLKVGMAAVFHVTNWIIVKPCELRNGRTYLRDPAAEPIEFFVLRRGDPRLRSVNTALSIIGCVIEEEASQFARKPKSTGGRSSLRKSDPIYFQPTSFGSKIKLHGNSPFLLDLSYKETPTNQFPLTSESEESEASGRDDFLALKAKELGFSVEELESAIATWSKSVQ